MDKMTLILLTVDEESLYRSTIYLIRLKYTLQIDIM
jgi:hypothetical protein